MDTVHRCSPLPGRRPLEQHAAEPIWHHGFRDTEDLADAGLPPTDAVGSVSGGREAGNQCAVEVEERTYIGTRRTGGELRDRG